jgi:long-chain fatty acid transport protein
VWFSYLCTQISKKIIQNMKKMISTLITCLFASSLFAGGLMTNTNQSAHFLRNPARGASMEIDAVYTNPAGLSHLSREGFHFTLNNQSAFQTRTITTTFAQFAMSGGNATKEFTGNASAWVIPSFFAAYKTGRWVFSGGFGIMGGGGELTFEKGLPSFEMPISMIPLNPGLEPLNITQYSVDMFLRGTSIIYGAQLGATFAINDMFSVFAGGRMAMVRNSHEGHLRDIQINPTVPGLNPDGNMMSAYTFFNAIGQTEQAAMVADQQLINSQSGNGFTPILGLNFNHNRLNVGVKYEFRTSLSVTNETEIDVQNMFPDGASIPHDIPAKLTVGAQYDIIPSVTLSAGWVRFFDQDARMANDRQDLLDGGVNEFLFGAEWRINNRFLVSAGTQVTRSSATDAYQTDLSHFLNSVSVGFGGAVDVTENIRINAGYFFTMFEDWEQVIPAGAAVPTPAVTNVFARTSQVFGIGVDFRF